jgi:hypothetical protein
MLIVVGAVSQRRMLRLHTAVFFWPSKICLVQDNILCRDRAKKKIDKEKLKRPEANAPHSDKK